MCSPLGRTTLTLPTRLLRGCLPARLCSCRRPGEAGDRPLGGEVAGGRRRVPGARTVCRAVLEHFDAEYGEWFGQRWLKFRAVMLAPNKWQYAALPNLFAMQQRREQSLDDGRSAGVAGLWCFLAQAGRPFPKLRHEPGRLKAFYVLNAASLLPVLALGVRSGERVLDMCAAPGGKTLGILQCAQPSLLCANEPDELRRRRLLLALESFVPRSALRSLVAVSARDGCELGALQPASYDKILVDAPCSNDRSWLYGGGSEALAELRVRERAHLPGLQTQLLRSALRAVKPGGIVVYATCTLNARENAGVVRAVLEGNAGVVDLADMARGLQGVFSLDGVPGGSGGGAGEQPGLLVVPEEGRAWGPLYLCKLRRRS
ncbi:unnamed protein product [Lampetra planeri]